MCDGSIGFIIIDAVLLCEPMCYKSCLVFVNFSCSVLLILNTHLQLAMFMSLGRHLTILQVCVSCRLFNSALIASSHLGQSGHNFASLMVNGSRPSAFTFAANSAKTASWSSSHVVDACTSLSLPASVLSTPRTPFEKVVLPSLPL